MKTPTQFTVLLEDLDTARVLGIFDECSGAEAIANAAIIATHAALTEDGWTCSEITDDDSGDYISNSVYSRSFTCEKNKVDLAVFVVVQKF